MTRRVMEGSATDANAPANLVNAGRDLNIAGLASRRSGDLPKAEAQFRRAIEFATADHAAAWVDWPGVCPTLHS